MSFTLGKLGVIFARIGQQSEGAEEVQEATSISFIVGGEFPIYVQAEGTRQFITPAGMISEEV